MLYNTILFISMITLSMGFVPLTTVNNNNALKMAVNGFSESVPFLKAPKNLEGLNGGVEFDPLGISDYVSVKWLRESELKHGRIAMLAVVGWLVQAAGIHLPSPNGLYDVANPIDAFFHVGFSPIAQIFIGIGALESINHNGKLSMEDMHKDSTRELGEFSPIFGSGQLKGKSAAEVDSIKLKELKNGRLAMLAIGGLVHHTLVTGTETFGPYSEIWNAGKLVISPMVKDFN
jgi:hypothetical protein